MLSTGILRYIFSDRYCFLLVSLILTCLASPLTETEQVGKVLMYACFTVVMLTALLANRQRKWILRPGIVVACLAVITNWSNFFSDTTNFHRVHLWVDILFFGFSAILILVAVFQDHMASVQAIFGSISVYLLLGLTWALAYVLLESYQENPFFFVDRQLDEFSIDGTQTTAFGQLIYFSFVTMSTLGYGDISPRTPLAQTLCWMQAVAGQLFIAVFVARLVSEWQFAERNKRSDTA